MATTRAQNRGGNAGRRAIHHRESGKGRHWQSPADYPFWGSSVYTREALLEYIERAAEGAPPD